MELIQHRLHMCIVAILLLFVPLYAAQPSPKQQQRISAAIKAATNASTIDYTAFVNPFIGTGMFCLALLIIITKHDQLFQTTLEMFGTEFYYDVARAYHTCLNLYQY